MTATYHIPENELSTFHHQTISKLQSRPEILHSVLDTLYSLVSTFIARVLLRDWLINQQCIFLPPRVRWDGITMREPNFVRLHCYWVDSAMSEGQVSTTSLTYSPSVSICTSFSINWYSSSLSLSSGKKTFLFLLNYLNLVHSYLFPICQSMKISDIEIT